MRIRAVLLTLLLAASQACVAEQLAERYYRSVFSGDLTWVPQAEASAPDEAELLGRFNERFLERRGTEAMNGIADPLVREAAAHFMDYWVDSLLDPQSLQRYEGDLERALEEALSRHGEPHGDEPVLDRLAAAIRDRDWGYQGGRTAPLLDFILWRETETREYSVALTDRLQPVTVHFLTGFVSEGWSHFATFGRSGTGGWAGDDALYCIRERYDLDSEGFLISYLKHEARHFADYELHPGLEQTDLEYRAKLTELSFADQEQQAMLKRFMAHADADSLAPHPRANWRVLAALAEKLDIDAVPDDPDGWQAVEGEPIRTAARALLLEDDQRLVSIEDALTP